MIHFLLSFLLAYKTKDLARAFNRIKDNCWHNVAKAAAGIVSFHSWRISTVPLSIIPPTVKTSPADSKDERSEWDPVPGQASDFILGLGVQELVDQGVAPFGRVAREQVWRDPGVDRVPGGKGNDSDVVLRGVEPHRTPGSR